MDLMAIAKVAIRDINFLLTTADERPADKEHWITSAKAVLYFFNNIVIAANCSDAGEADRLSRIYQELKSLIEKRR